MTAKKQERVTPGMLNSQNKLRELLW